jgi:hypothetical protein
VDFDFYVAARRRLLVEHAVELGLTESAATTLVDAELSSSRRRIERADDPDAFLFRAVEEAVGRAGRVDSEPWQHRRLVVAATVVLVLVAAAGLLTREATRPAPSVTVPSTFALGVTGATAALREVGLRVDVVDAPGCEPTGLVVGTSPSSGTAVDLGSTVTLAAAGAPGPRCAPSDARTAAWAFLRFTRGGPAPTFDDTVFVVYNGREPAILSRSAATDPRRWAAIQAVADLLRSPPQSTGGDGLSLRVAEIVPPATQCGIVRPPSTGDRSVLRVLVVSDQRTCPLTIDLYRSGSDEIDAVVIYDRE